MACRRRRSSPSSDAGAATRFYFIDTLRKPTRAELEAAAHHHDGDGHEIEGNGNGHHALTSGEADHLAK